MSRPDYVEFARRCLSRWPLDIAADQLQKDAIETGMIQLRQEDGDTVFRIMAKDIKEAVSDDVQA